MMLPCSLLDLEAKKGVKKASLEILEKTGGQGRQHITWKSFTFPRPFKICVPI